MDRREFLELTVVATAGLFSEGKVSRGTTGSNALGKYTVAVYYFPGWHGKTGKINWKRLEEARPRYKGEYEPEIPLWGQLGGNKAKVMAKYIDAMTTHGINTIIFDWYRFQATSVLEGSLRDGLLKAPNRHQIRFALMWANQDVPGHRAPVGQKRFYQIADDAISYFKHPSYWTIDGKSYFSIYMLGTLLQELGGVAKTRAALNGFRQRVSEAGLPGLHLNLVTWRNVRGEMLHARGQPVPGDPAKKITTLEQLIAALGFDSATWYTWTHWVSPRRPFDNYKRWGNAAIAFWNKQPTTGVPFFPNVTMGWDGMPQHEKGVVLNNTPKDFREFLREAKHWLDTHPASMNTLTINAWNEWGEGSYLEPDAVHRMAYLNAVRDVFGRSE